MTKLSYFILANVIFAREQYSLNLCDNPTLLSSDHFTIEGTNRETTEVRVDNENLKVVQVAENSSVLWMLEYAGEVPMSIIDALKFTFNNASGGQEVAYSVSISPIHCPQVGEVSQSSTVPAWIIVVAVLMGVILLGAIIISIYHFVGPRTRDAENHHL